MICFQLIYHDGLNYTYKYTYVLDVKQNSQRHSSYFLKVYQSI